MQISWSLLCCTILQAVYYVDILVIFLLHNTLGSVLCRYLGHHFAAQYCRQHTIQISWSLLCCTILLHNTVGSVLCTYLGHYFAAQYCRQRTIQISWSLLCCTILQAAYYVDNFVITLLHNILGSILCRYLGHYFAAQYYQVDILVITLLHIVGSVLCRYLGHYSATQYCRQRTMQISWSLLCFTILQAAYHVDILVVTLLHNIVGSVLCCTILQAAYYSRYLLMQAYYVDILVITAQYCRLVDILVITLLHIERIYFRYFAAQYCRQRTQISWSLLYCTILQAAYYVDILVITLLHNIVGCILCRYLGRYFVAQYCRQRTMWISWSLLCCTILQAAYYVDILVITLLHNTVVAYYVDILVVTLLHNTVGSVLYRYLGRFFAAQYCMQRTMQISWSLLCCTILQKVYYEDILVITLLHNTVGSVLCRYLGRYFAAQYCRQRTMQISWSLLCCTILQAALYVDILDITLHHNIVGRVLCRYLDHYSAAQYCSQSTMQISWSLLCCTILQAVYYVDILDVTLLHNIVGSVLCR